jgi:hypothetical protein
MKDPSEWNESDLLGLVSDQVKESVVRDYKAPESLENRDAKKIEISKDVSAFANSAGGTIVYGILEKGQIPIGLEGVDPLKTSREWIEQVINSRIQRRIDGIRINQIALTATHPGKVAYVVTIPQSTRAPHMAADNRFYKRFNFQSVPMEEYEVREPIEKRSRHQEQGTQRIQQLEKVGESLLALQSRAEGAAQAAMFGSSTDWTPAEMVVMVPVHQRTVDYWTAMGQLELALAGVPDDLPLSRRIARELTGPAIVGQLLPGALQEVKAALAQARTAKEA